MRVIPAPMNSITAKNFASFTEVQMSGKTNMMDASTVSALAGISREKVMSIITNYEKLDKKFSKQTA